MTKRVPRPLLALLALFWLLPSSVWAYSYGNANTEDIAVTFTTINAKLTADPADWDAAKAAYEERKSEMTLHFGDAVPKELDAAFAAKDPDRVIADMKGVLAFNIERRFKYAKEGFSDYNQAKLLLAKARATYEALKPFMTDTVGADGLRKLDDDFETALKALGNPGLFGVGKEEPDQALFEKTLQQIDDTIHPLYPFEGAVVLDDPTDESGSSAAPSAGAGSAAAQEADKTNPAITIGVLAAVVVIGAGIAWWTRRRRK